MILYHGTVKRKAEKIMKDGFSRKVKPTWKVASKPGFVYLSLAYAPFYTFAQHNERTGALIKVEVKEEDLYPEDDFLMLYLYKKSIYSQSDIDLVDMERYKLLYGLSLKYMGNACAKPWDIKVLGVRYFDTTNLLMVCDPIISPHELQNNGRLLL